MPPDPGGDTPPVVVRPDLDAKLRSIEAFADFCEGAGIPARPLELFLEVSNVCDLKCAMCQQFSALNPNRLIHLKSRERGFMDASALLPNLTEALRGALVVHCFGYGEPTLHPGFRDLIDWVAAHGAMADFFSNGMHLDPDLCAFLVERRVAQVTISFSGSTPEVYESIYQGGDFARVLGGIAAIAKAKRAAGSTYPVIAINSLGFRAHVDTFEAFVALMAEHGANTIMLQRLNVHPDIPQMHEHVSIMRPEVEGRIVERAVALGRRLGVLVNATRYVEGAAADEAEHERRQEALRTEAQALLAARGGEYGRNPITRFKELASTVRKVNEPARGDRRHAALALDADDAAARAALHIRTPDAAGRGGETFHCLEPFKTLYVTRNGAAKPCCFANADRFLGDVGTDDATSVWLGAGFRAVRAGIARGEYPMGFCRGCLANRSAPRAAFSAGLVQRYMNWVERLPGVPPTEDWRRRSHAALRRMQAIRPAAAMASVTGPAAIAADGGGAARRVSTDLAESDPAPSPASLHESGLRMRRLARRPEALAAFTAAVAADPAHPWYCCSLAQELLEQGQIEAAEAAFVALLEQQPRFAPALNGLALLRRRQGDREGALRLFEAAAAAEPRNGRVAASAAAELFALGRLDEAEQRYRDILVAEPRMAAALNGMGLVLQRRGRPAEALARFRAALEVEPGREWYRRCVRVAEDALRTASTEGRCDERPSDRPVAVAGVAS